MKSRVILQNNTGGIAISVKGSGGKLNTKARP